VGADRAALSVAFGASQRGDQAVQSMRRRAHSVHGRGRDLIAIVEIATARPYTMWTRFPTREPPFETFVSRQRRNASCMLRRH
jgi:hypothetical protein